MDKPRNVSDASWHVLQGCSDFLLKKNVDDDGYVDWDTLCTDPSQSHGERILTDAAQQIQRGFLNKAAGRLDDANWRRFIEALVMLRPTPLVFGSETKGSSR